VYEGGIRSPFFAHWSGQLKPRKITDRIAAHIDVLPTILEACGVAIPKNLPIDGRSLWPLLTGRASDWPERTLFIQSHRGDRPVLYHNVAVRTDRWKLVHNSGFGKEQFSGEPRFELFDMAGDPFETQDVSAGHPGIVEDLKRRYEAWFAEVGNTRPDNYAPPRIHLAAPREDTVVLTRQDWRGAAWGLNDCGHWEVMVTRKGRYDVKLLFQPLKKPGTARFRLGRVQVDKRLEAGEVSVLFGGVELAVGPGRLEAFIEQEGRMIGVTFVEVSRCR